MRFGGELNLHNREIQNKQAEFFSDEKQRFWQPALVKAVWSDSDRK